MSPGGSALRVDALRQTLAFATPHEVDALAAELLAIAGRARRPVRAAAARALILHWRRLTPDARRTLTALGAPTLHGLLRAMLRDADPDAQVAAASAAADLADPALLPAVIDHVLATPGSSPEVLDAAEASVNALIDGAATPAERRAIGLALGPLADRFEAHRRPALLAAFLRLAEHAGPTAGSIPRATLRPWLLQADHPCHLVFRGIIRKSPEPWARAAALSGLTHESLKAACLQR
ncbi:MAG: hypothetical protein KIT68_11760, partial [Phycisphaeraceae bacterium]|nr:hypothetical protein [Phycisphaeraceae bacterium]